MARKAPAWRRLVEEGWVASREEAQRWIMSGKVRAGESPVRTAGEMIDSGAPLSVRGIDQRYVSKGGLKLEGALRDFGIPVQGRVCIDAGASTGGFTDCLVQHGAALVHAVDVGYGQLAGSLRAHLRVVNHEKTNIGDEALCALSPRPSLGTVDLSYLSLRKAVPQFARILGGEGELVCLVKPLFEIDDAQARRTGRIDEAAYLPLLVSLAGDMTTDGFAVRGVTHSPVTGNNGTLEFFLHVDVGGEGGMPQAAFARRAQEAVDAAKALPAYHKEQ